jgi:hypothetical protein
MRLLALSPLLFALDAQALTVSCDMRSPCTASITFTATVAASANLSLEEEVLPNGNRLITAVESCTGCEEPALPPSTWLVSAGAPAVYRYGQGMAELHSGRWYASRRAEPRHVAGR